MPTLNKCGVKLINKMKPKCQAGALTNLCQPMPTEDFFHHKSVMQLKVIIFSHKIIRFCWIKKAVFLYNIQHEQHSYPNLTSVAHVRKLDELTILNQ